VLQGAYSGGEPHQADDVAKVRWISADEVDGTDFDWEHDRKFGRAALQSGDRRSG
jgi:hypothetical protein